MTTLFTKTQALAKCRPLLYAAVGVLSTLGVLSLTHLGPAQAQSPGVNLAALVAQVSALTTQVNTLKAQMTTVQGRATVLETTTAPLSVSGTPGKFPATLSITGVNVHIVSGLGSTNDANPPHGGTLSGLGNLIIGYNALGSYQGEGDVRTGSHNLILGDRNNYSSFGGLVAGNNNTISGQYASVSAGTRNTASGDFASVSSGGVVNTASGPYSSVSGGNANTASGNNASASGGHLNTASGSFASVSGGYGNTASGFYASVSGGDSNTAGSPYASVSGGNGLTQNNFFGWTGGAYHSP